MTFNGDIEFIQQWEGHKGRLFHPGGESSGITLDPGLDLGQANFVTLTEVYGDLLTYNQIMLCKQILGLRGLAAKRAIEETRGLAGIRISREQARDLLPKLARPFWDQITDRFSCLKTAPGAVQTALLSLAYNRGARNPNLECLGRPLLNGEWHEVARLIGEMQQSHQLRGVRLRRTAEAKLIYDYLKETVAQPQSTPQ